MKKIFAALLLFCITLVVVTTNTEAATPTTVYVDGKKLNVSVATKNGTVLVPLRQVSEALGLKVTYNAKNNSSVITHPYRSLYATHVAKTNVVQKFVNGSLNQTKKLAIPSVQANGVTYVPARFFEQLDAEVYWNAKDTRVEISSYELKMNQYTIMATLSYDDLGKYANNSKTVTSIISNSPAEYVKTIKNLQKDYSIYTTYTPSSFAKEMQMQDWVIKDYSKVTKGDGKGFVGYTFRNTKTNEIAFAFRGTDGLNADWWSNLRSFVSKDIAVLNKVGNNQKQHAFDLFKKSVNAGSSVTLIGHSLGGNLAQGVAANYPTQYDKLVTFNAFGSGMSPKSGSEYNKITNFVLSKDVVKGLRSQYGTVVKFKERKETKSSHKLYNFYSYIFKPDSKYWANKNYGVPYAK